MNIIFMGTPNFAKEHLQELINKKEELGIKIDLVVTKEDKEVGRGKKITYTPVKELAIANQIEVYQPTNLRDEEVVNKIKSLNPDLIIVVAYGKIIPKSIIDIPKHGIINVHGSLLPKYRGAAPVQYAVLNGDTKTGVTIMYIEEGLDSGDMILKKEFELTVEDTTTTTFEKMQEVGKEGLVEAISLIKNNEVNAIKQDENLVTFAPMITKEMANISWEDNGINILNKVRCFDGIGGAKGIINDVEYKIWKVEILDNINELENSKIGDYLVTKSNLYIKASDSIVSILEIQAPNKKRMNISDFLRGSKI